MKTVLLGEVAQIISGQSPNGKFYNHDAKGLPLYQGKKDFGAMFTADPSVWTTEITKVAEPNDILISVRAPVGPVNLASQKINIGRGLAAIRPWEGLDPTFLFRYLQYKKDEIAKLGGGTTFQSINRIHLKNLTVPYPDIKDQKRIVKKLDQAFAEIDKAKHNTEKNLHNSKELFRSYLKNEIKKETYKWRSLEFENCLEKVKYPKKIQRKNFQAKGKYPIISQERDYINGYWDGADELFQLSKPVIVFGDHTQVLKYIDFDFVLGADGVKILQTKDIIHPKFLYYYLKSLDIEELGYARHYRILKEKNIYFPDSLEKQTVLVKAFDEIQQKAQKLQELYKKKITALEELHQSILKQAYEGNL